MISANRSDYSRVSIFMANRKIDVTCANCATVCHSEEAHIGKYLRCPKCGSVVQIIDPTSAASLPNRAQSITAEQKKRPVDRRTVLSWVLGVIVILLCVVVSYLVRQIAAPSSTDVKSSYIEEPVPSTASALNRTVDTKNTPSPPSPGNDDPKPASGFFIGESSTVPKDCKRLPNGERLAEDSGTNGRGELSIDNGTDEDTVVRLQNEATDETVRFLFVRSKDKIALTDIEPGRYSLIYTFGQCWDEENELFAVSPEYREFGKVLVYGDRDGSFDSISVTLHTVPFGNVRSKQISRSRFLRSNSRQAQPVPAGVQSR